MRGIQIAQRSQVCPAPPQSTGFWCAGIFEVLLALLLAAVLELGWEIPYHCTHSTAWGAHQLDMSHSISPAGALSSKHDKKLTDIHWTSTGAGIWGVARAACCQVEVSMAQAPHLQQSAMQYSDCT